MVIGAEGLIKSVRIPSRAFEKSRHTMTQSRRAMTEHMGLSNMWLNLDMSLINLGIL